MAFGIRSALSTPAASSVAVADDAESRVTSIGIVIPEAGMIKEVLPFQAELQIARSILVESETLHDGDVCLPIAGTANEVPEIGRHVP